MVSDASVSGKIAKLQGAHGPFDIMFRGSSFLRTWTTGVSSLASKFQVPETSKVAHQDKTQLTTFKSISNCKTAKKKTRFSFVKLTHWCFRVSLEWGTKTLPSLSEH